MAAEVGWTATLDDFEAHLAAQRDALSAGRPQDVTPFRPPSPLGPLPEALEERATRLLAESRDLESLVADARHAIHTRLNAPPSSAGPARPPRTASYLDARV